VFLAIAVFVASRILTSDIGLELFVLGVDERTAAAMGVRTPRRKLELFVLGCVFAALGGAAYAGTQQFVPETLVDPTAELALLIMLFIGGRRSIIGAVIGALVIQYLQGAWNWVSVNILVVEGLLLTAVLLVDPEGLAGIVNTGVAWLRGRRDQPALKIEPALEIEPVTASQSFSANEFSASSPAPAQEKATAAGLQQYFAGMKAAGLSSQDQILNSQEGWDAGLEINWAITQAGTVSDESAIMGKLQHLDINTLGILWTRTPANYESYSQVLAAMEIINPDGSATLFK
jgi:hypothetical protein